MKTTKKLGIILAGVLAGVLLVGFGILLGSHMTGGNDIHAAENEEQIPPDSAPAFSESTADDADSSEAIHDVVPTVHTNASGQTFGSALGLEESEWPDLVLVANEDGVEGYLPKEFLLEDMPQTPEEAVARTKTIEAAEMLRTQATQRVQMVDSEGKPLAGVSKTIPLLAE